MTLFSQLVSNSSLVTADSTQTLINKTLNSPILVTPNLGVASASSITANLGAVGTPSYTFTGDTNTGMWSPAADTLAFSGGGTEVIRINSSGQVGIGTSAPSTRFSIVPAADIALPTGTLQTAIGEFSNNSNYQLRTGYTYSVGPGYQGVINALAGGSGTDLLLNPSGGNVIVGGNLTLSTKIVPNVQSVASAATITPNANTNVQVSVTALAVAATIASPSGTPSDGQRLMFRFEDNGTAKALTWTTSSGGYRVVGATLPTTTVAGKVTYVGCVYNSTDIFWDVIAAVTQG